MTSSLTWGQRARRIEVRPHKSPTDRTSVLGTPPAALAPPARWARFSPITAIVSAASFVAQSSGSGGAAAILVFTATVVLAWAWLAAVSVKPYRMAS